MKTLVPLLGLLVACGPGPEEDPCTVPGNICTYAGVAKTAMFGEDGIQANASHLYLPQDITFDAEGRAWLPDFNNHRIREIAPDGIVTTVSGTGFLGDGPEGPSETAAWNHPTSVTLDPNDPCKLHVAAWHNSRIHLVNLCTGETTFECGTGERDFAGDGDDALSAVLDLPSSLVFSDDGTMYITDQANQAIRSVSPDGTIGTIAGDPGEPYAALNNSDPANEPIQDATPGYAGDGGPAADALLFAEIGQQADPSSKMTIADNVLYIADSGNNIIRTIDLATMTIDRIAGVQYNRGDDGAPSNLSAGDGGSALDAVFNNPRDVAVGIDGELYIADTDNHCIRVIEPDGTIDTFAGTCGLAPQPGDPFEGEGILALDAQLWSPYGVATDSEGNVYIADTKNHIIRKVAR